MASPVLRTIFAATPAMLDSTSPNSTVSSGESTTNILSDRINLMAATTVLGFTYGIMTTLYITTTYHLLRKLFRNDARCGSHPQSLMRSRDSSRKTIFYLVYTFVLFVLATLYTAGNSQNAIIAYVDNRLYPGGPYLYYITYMAGESIMVMTDITSLIILWMTDALILSRFILFYHKLSYARWIIPLPCAMYVGVIVLSTLVLQGEAGLGKIFYLSENLMLAYYSLSLSLNVFSTVLIAARLYFHKVQLDRIFGSRMESPYMNIATMLIESASLYGTWSLVFLILCIRNSPGQTVVLATMSQIQVIAPLLIILWISRGKAWDTSKSEAYSIDNIPDALPSADSVVSRLSFGSRPRHGRSVNGDFGFADAHFRRGAIADESRSTVVGCEPLDVNMIELGMCGSEPPSTIDEFKVDPVGTTMDH